MSAYMMNEETMMQIADFTSCLLNNGYNYFGFSGNIELDQAFQNCKTKYGGFKSELIYDFLYRENLRAVNALYKNEEKAVDCWEEYKAIPAIYQPKEWDCKNQIHVVEKWHYELLKKIDCYLYQISEGDYANSHIYKGMKELRSSLADFIIMNNANYVNSQWG